MAISSGGRNREYHCASVVLKWAATGAGTLTSDVMVPPGAQIVSYSTMAGATVPATGTNIEIKVGGTAVGATIARAKYGTAGLGTTAVVADGAVASLSGAISVTTTGTHDTGVTKVSICYIV